MSSVSGSKIFFFYGKSFGSKRVKDVWNRSSKEREAEIKFVERLNLKLR